MNAMLPRPTILTIEPYAPGASKVEGVNRITKLSSNEGAFGPPPGAMAARPSCARRSAGASAWTPRESSAAPAATKSCSTSS